MLRTIFVLFIIMAITIVQAQAGAYTNPVIIDRITFQFNGSITLYTEGSHGNPLNCNNDSAIAISSTLNTDPGYQTIVSTIITAHTAKLPVEFFLVDCGTSGDVGHVGDKIRLN